MTTTTLLDTRPSYDGTIDLACALLARDALVRIADGSLAPPERVDPERLSTGDLAEWLMDALSFAAACHYGPELVFVSLSTEEKRADIDVRLGLARAAQAARRAADPFRAE